MKAIAVERYPQILLLSALLAVALLGGETGNAAEARCEAMVGEPFGIAEFNFPVDPDDEIAWQSRGIRLTESSGRALHPILEHPGFLHRMASRIEGEFPAAPGRATIFFLFTGDQPLQLSVSTDPDRVLTVVPEPFRAGKFGRMTRKWWKHIWGPLGDRLRDSNRPRPVENYLAGVGIWRLNINRHPAIPRTSAGTMGELVLGTSRLRADMSRLVSFDACCQEPASLPLPPPVVWQTIEPAEIGELTVEAMASRVPEECFYIRFGKYSNMLWATRLLEAQGEELQRLVTLRGFQGRANAKIQTQLAIQELPFADLIGDQLIQDVALIGRDFFVTDGATFGVILQSENSVLAAGLASVRKKAINSWKNHGATSETLTIAGRKVSLISTPDNRLRSFHVFDDGWHLITNSSALVERFLRVPEEKNSLADLPAFRYLRSELPPARNDAVFAYISAKFMEGLSTPRNLIELQRRLRSRAELQMLEVAVRAARAEQAAWQGSGMPLETLDETADVVSQLKSRQLLPPGFGCRSDGSEPRWIAERAIDTLRGGMGSFLPIVDMPVAAANAEEVRVYSEFAAKHRGSWSSLDPVAARIRREEIPEKAGRERLQIEFLVSPLQRCNATLLCGLLGQPTRERIVASEGALISGEVILNGRLLPSGQDARLQLTIEDGPEIPATSRTRLIDLLAIARQLKMRLLVEPGEAAFQRKMWQAAGTPDDPFWYGPFDLVGRLLKDHAAIAFDLEELRGLPANLKKTDWDQAAQAFLEIGELRGSSLDALITGIASTRATRGSLRNVQLFHQWSNLLATPLDQSPQLVEQLVGMQPVCPLDGAYELRATVNGSPLWVSSAIGENSLSVANLVDYDAALLRWWRGLEATARVDEQGLHIQAALDVEFAMPASKSVGGFPFFNNKKK